MTTATHVKTAYSYRDEPAVVTFLHRHARAVPVLIEASRMLPRYFGASPSLVLEVLTDPEEPGATSLFVLIQTPLEPDEAIPLLDRFNDRWWRTASNAVEADIHFGLDYV